MINRQFWQDKRVLLTGHTGFKGSWMSMVLNALGSSICGVALKPHTIPSLFEILEMKEKVENNYLNINDHSVLANLILEFEPDIIFHLAAQPLVSRSYKSPIETMETNIFGTLGLLEGIRKYGKKVKCVINITSDKVYLNEINKAFSEEDALGGRDPYSSSKACSDIVSMAYGHSYFNKLGISLATARSGNVIGGGDWSEDRLIPDLVRLIEASKNLLIRNPKAIRPWQHVLEPISGYLLLAQSLYEKKVVSTDSWNFGPAKEDCISVTDLLERVNKLSKYHIFWEEPICTNFYEAPILMLDSDKAKKVLGWRPKWSLNKSLQMTVDWYEKWIDKKDMYDLTLEQLFEYFGKATLS